MKRLNRLISSVVLVAFIFNTAVQDYAFGLSTMPGSTQAGTRTAMFAAGQKELATRDYGPGSGISSQFDDYVPDQFIGEVPGVYGLAFVSSNYINGLPKGWSNNTLLKSDVSDLVEAFKHFRDTEALLSENDLEITEGDFELEKGNTGEIPICRIEKDGRTFKYKLVLHKDFVRMWADIKKNDVWFEYIFPDGKVRTISLAWAIFYRIAKHEMADMVTKDGLDIFTPKSHGHMEYSMPFSEWSDTFKVNDKPSDERAANEIGGRYAIVNDAIWMWFLGSYCFPGPSTKYNDETFTNRALWFLGLYEGPHAEEWNRWAVEHNLPDEFPNLHDASNRVEALAIARAVNKRFWTNYTKYEPPVDPHKEAIMAKDLAERKPHISKVLPATGKGEPVYFSYQKLQRFLNRAAHLAIDGSQDKDFSIIYSPRGDGAWRIGDIRKVRGQLTFIQGAFGPVTLDWEEAIKSIGSAGNTRYTVTVHLSSGEEHVVDAGVENIPEYFGKILSSSTWISIHEFSGDEVKHPARTRPGKSPDDLLMLIGRYIKLSEVITAPKLYDLYAAHYKEFGFEAPAKRESALRTIERDLFDADNSIFAAGIIRELPEKGPNGERQFVEFVHAAKDRGAQSSGTPASDATKTVKPLPLVDKTVTLRNKAGATMDIRIQTLREEDLKVALEVNSENWGRNFELTNVGMKDIYESNPGGHLVARDAATGEIIALVLCGSLYAKSVEDIPNHLRNIAFTPRGNNDNTWLHYAVSVARKYRGSKGFAREISGALLDATAPLREGMRVGTYSPMSGYGEVNHGEEWYRTAAAYLLTCGFGGAKDGKVEHKEIYLDERPAEGVRTFREFLKGRGAELRGFDWQDYLDYVRYSGFTIEEYVKRTNEHLACVPADMHIRKGARIARVIASGREGDFNAAEAAFIAIYKDLPGEGGRFTIENAKSDALNTLKGLSDTDFALVRAMCAVYGYPPFAIVTTRMYWDEEYAAMRSRNPNIPANVIEMIEAVRMAGGIDAVELNRANRNMGQTGKSAAPGMKASEPVSRVEVDPVINAILRFSNDPDISLLNKSTSVREDDATLTIKDDRGVVMFTIVCEDAKDGAYVLHIADRESHIFMDGFKDQRALAAGVRTILEKFKAVPEVAALIKARAAVLAKREAERYEELLGAKYQVMKTKGGITVSFDHDILFLGSIAWSIISRDIVEKRGEEILSGSIFTGGRARITGNGTTDYIFDLVKVSPDLTYFEMTHPMAPGFGAFAKGIIRPATPQDSVDLKTLNVTIADNASEASKIEARMIVDQVKAKPNSVIGLKTGGSAIPVYVEVIRLTKEEKVDWSGVVTFNLDEYVGIPVKHPESYRNFMYRNLFQQLIPYGLRMENTNVPEASAKSPWQEMADYVKKIKAAGGIDLWALGIGSDGHFGFLEPAVEIGSEEMALLSGRKLTPDNTAVPLVRKIRDFNEFVIQGFDESSIEKAIISIVELQNAARENLGRYEDLVDARLAASKIHGQDVSREEAASELYRLGQKLKSQSGPIFYVDLPSRDRARLMARLLRRKGFSGVSLCERQKYFADESKVVNLAIPTLIDNSRFFPDINMVPLRAMTATGIVKTAKRITQLATGKGKAEAVLKTLSLPETAECPSTTLKYHPGFMMILDKEAASLLGASKDAPSGSQSGQKFQDPIAAAMDMGGSMERANELAVQHEVKGALIDSVVADIRSGSRTDRIRAAQTAASIDVSTHTVEARRLSEAILEMSKSPDPKERGAARKAIRHLAVNGIKEFVAVVKDFDRAEAGQRFSDPISAAADIAAANESLGAIEREAAYLLRIATEILSRVELAAKELARSDQAKPGDEYGEVDPDMAIPVFGAVLRHGYGTDNAKDAMRKYLRWIASQKGVIRYYRIAASVELFRAGDKDQNEYATIDVSDATMERIALLDAGVNTDDQVAYLTKVLENPSMTARIYINILAALARNRVASEKVIEALKKVSLESQYGAKAAGGLLVSGDESQIENLNKMARREDGTPISVEASIFLLEHFDRKTSSTVSASKSAAPGMTAPAEVTREAMTLVSLEKIRSEILRIASNNGKSLNVLTVGAFRETKQGEDRTGLTPDVVRMLRELGIRVVIEKGTGLGSGFADEDYIRAGAQLLNDRKEVIETADIIQHIKELQPDEIEMVKAANWKALNSKRSAKIIWNFNHFANCLKDMAEKAQTRPERLLANARTGASFVSFENVRTSEGYPILKGASEKAGVVGAYEMAVYMLSLDKKTGIIDEERRKGLESVAGMMLKEYDRTNDPYPNSITINSMGLFGKKVVVYGGGNVGYNQARILALLGAKVAVIEKNPDRIQWLEREFTKSGLGDVVVVSSQNGDWIDKVLKEYNDGLSTTTYVHGAKAQKLISKDMVRRLGPGRVYTVIDIDQGGGIEGVRETSHEKPVYMESGSVFYCVPNIPARVPRQTSIDISLSAAKYLAVMALYGLDRAAKILPELNNAIDVKGGEVSSPIIRDQFSVLKSAAPGMTAPDDDLAVQGRVVRSVEDTSSPSALAREKVMAESATRTTDQALQALADAEAAESGSERAETVVESAIKKLYLQNYSQSAGLNFKDVLASQNDYRISEYQHPVLSKAKCIRVYYRGKVVAVYATADGRTKFSNKVPQSATGNDLGFMTRGLAGYREAITMLKDMSAKNAFDMVFVRRIASDARIDELGFELARQLEEAENDKNTVESDILRKIAGALRNAYSSISASQDNLKDAFARGEKMREATLAQAERYKSARRTLAAKTNLGTMLGIEAKSGLDNIPLQSINLLMRDLEEGDLSDRIDNVIGLLGRIKAASKKPEQAAMASRAIAEYDARTGHQQAIALASGNDDSPIEVFGMEKNLILEMYGTVVLESPSGVVVKPSVIRVFRHYKDNMIFYIADTSTGSDYDVREDDKGITFVQRRSRDPYFELAVETAAPTLNWTKELEGLAKTEPQIRDAALVAYEYIKEMDSVKLKVDEANGVVRISFPDYKGGTVLEIGRNKDASGKKENDYYLWSHDVIHPDMGHKEEHIKELDLSNKVIWYFEMPETVFGGESEAPSTSKVDIETVRAWMKDVKLYFGDIQILLLTMARNEKFDMDVVRMIARHERYGAFIQQFVATQNMHNSPEDRILFKRVTDAIISLSKDETVIDEKAASGTAKHIPEVISEYAVKVMGDAGPGLIEPSVDEIASFYPIVNMLEGQRVEIYLPKGLSDSMTRSVTEEIKSINKKIRERIIKKTGRNVTDDPINILPYDSSNLERCLERKGDGVRRIFINDLLMTADFKRLADPANDVGAELLRGKRVITMAVPKGKNETENTVNQSCMFKIGLLSALLDESNVLTVGEKLKEELYGRISSDMYSKFINNLASRDDSVSRDAVRDRINYFLLPGSIVKISTLIGEQLRILKAFWIAA